MAIEKIRYKDLVDYAERNVFGDSDAEVKFGKELMGLIKEIDADRAEKGKQGDLYLSTENIEFLLDNGFKGEPFWAYLKDGKTPEYGSPLTDYQEAYLDYMTDPLHKVVGKNGKVMETRQDLFKELKTMEKVVTEIGSSQEVKYMSVARGQADLSKLPKNQSVGNVPYMKQVAYGKDGLYGQINAVYAEMAKDHDPKLVQQLKDLELMVAKLDNEHNDAQLYGTPEFVQGKDGKEELHYTINAPLIKDEDGRVKLVDNEAMTVRVTDKGIEGAKYTDFNLYYDELVAQIPDKNGYKVQERKGKIAAEYLKQHPNEDYPDPSRIQQLKVEGSPSAKWVYVLPDMSYPEKGSPEPFTRDFAGVCDSMVSDSLKNVGQAIEKVAIQQEKEKAQEFKPWVAPSHSVARDKGVEIAM